MRLKQNVVPDLELKVELRFDTVRSESLHKWMVVTAFGPKTAKVTRDWKKVRRPNKGFVMCNLYELLLGQLSVRRQDWQVI